MQQYDITHITHVKLTYPKKLTDGRNFISELNNELDGLATVENVTDYSIALKCSNIVDALKITEYITYLGITDSGIGDLEEFKIVIDGDKKILCLKFC